jgi:hypothetical protein
MSPNKFYLKANKTNLDVGFTSEIMDFVKQVDLSNKTIRETGWKKVY